MLPVLLSGVVALSGCAWEREGVPHTEDEAIAYVRANVGADADVARVRRFCESRSIEYVYDEKQRIVHGIIRDVASSGLVARSIRLEMTFDNEERLKEVAAHIELTGP